MVRFARAMLVFALVVMIGCTQSVVDASPGGPITHEPTPNAPSPESPLPPSVPVEDDASPPPVTHSGRVWPPERAGYINPIIAENKLPGDARWSRFVKKNRSGQIEGYADRVSVHAGEKVGIHLSSDMKTRASWFLYRLGWYGGAGAREVSTGHVDVSPQPPCPPNKATGLIRCEWPVAVELAIPADAVSGLWLLKVVREDDWATWVPLVVSDDRPADLLFQASVTTWQAYNDWGGVSLYRDHTKSLPYRHGVEVSFDRPYAEGVGAGQMLRWEVHFARFLEKAGYDVSYTTNVDVAAHSVSWLARRGAFLSVGHDEYWTKSERDVLEQARDLGVPLLFFSANTAYWQIRLKDDSGRGARTMVGYKGYAGADPDQGVENSGRFRDPPLNRPENALIGIMYDKWQAVRGPFVVEDPAHFLFNGSGLHKGDALIGLMGYETDARFANGHEPKGLHVAASADVVSVEGAPGRAEVASYVGSGGGLVFAAGSIEWALGLGGSDVVDPRVERMTANVLERALGVKPREPVGEGAPRMSRIDGPFASEVTTLVDGLDEAVAVAPLRDGALAVVDAQGNRVLRVGPAPERLVSVLAGHGLPAGEHLAQPTGILALSEDVVLVADSKNHCLRKLTVSPVVTLTTVAGRCGQDGFVDGAGEDARFAFPMGLARDTTNGEVLIADSWNQVVRAYDPVTGLVRTVAGSGEGGWRDGPASEAAFYYPTAVAVDGDGRYYVASSGTFTIARVDVDAERTVTTIAGGRIGGSDGPGDVATLGAQAGLLFVDGAVVFSDPGCGRVRRILPGAKAADARVSTLAGAPRLGRKNGRGEAAEFRLPLGLALDASGALLVADGTSVRRVVR